jgi:hypothetical protein
MNYVTINQDAAAAAVDLLIGQQGREILDKLYNVINGAMLLAYAKGVQDGETDSKDNWDAGYQRGYSDGIDVATGGEQPEGGFYDAGDGDGGSFGSITPCSEGSINLAPYQGDSGDEAVSDNPDYWEDVKPLDEWIKDPATGNWVERPKTNPFAWS